MRKLDYLVPKSSVVLLEAEAYVCASARVDSFEEGDDINLDN